MTTRQSATAQALSLKAVLPALAALLLGGFVLFGVGFAQGLHDAAHDSRHSLAFPCH